MTDWRTVPSCAERRREGGRRGGLATAAGMTPAERSARARRGGLAAHTPAARARLLAAAWAGLSPAEREAVAVELLPIAAELIVALDRAHDRRRLAEPVEPTRVVTSLPTPAERRAQVDELLRAADAL